MRKSISLLSCVVLASLQFACAEKKQLTEMHGATIEMRDQTKHLGATSDEMNKTTTKLAETSDKMLTNTSQLNETSKDMLTNTQELKETSKEMLVNTQELKEKTAETKRALDEMKGVTEELYDANRQGMALGLRRELIKKLHEMPAMENKLAIAAQYFLSFEIQLWQDFGQDKQSEARLKLAKDAAMEFLLEAEGLAPKRGKVAALSDVTEIKWLDSLMSNNPRASFNALAAMMHKMNRKQVNQLNKTQSDAMSLYDLIEKGLTYDLQYQKGQVQLSEVPEFAKEVIFHKDIAIQLLQTRMNVLPTIFMARVSGLNQKTLIGKLKQLYLPGQTWTLNFDELHGGIVEYYNRELLDQAVRSRRLLEAAGVTPKVEVDVLKLYHQMKVVSSQRLGKTEDLEKQKMLKSLDQIFHQSNPETDIPALELDVVLGP
ncbi:MAG: hypothetical protein BroJett040_03230 [Oligoflexia bacterium]|nr:MAG: hypothetical protein BroJett040_03230 [Oligoflexia bacterium]